jgi:hypothetical protein
MSRQRQAEITDAHWLRDYEKWQIRLRSWRVRDQRCLVRVPGSEDDDESPVEARAFVRSGIRESNPPNGITWRVLGLSKGCWMRSGAVRFAQIGTPSGTRPPSLLLIEERRGHVDVHRLG